MRRRRVKQHRHVVLVGQINCLADHSKIHLQLQHHDAALGNHCFNFPQFLHRIVHIGAGDNHNAVVPRFVEGNGADACCSLPIPQNMGGINAFFRQHREEDVAKTVFPQLARHGHLAA